MSLPAGINEPGTSVRLPRVAVHAQATRPFFSCLVNSTRMTSMLACSVPRMRVNLHASAGQNGWGQNG